MRPLHHGDGTGDSANWLQRFNDSDAGVLTGGILHSVGALLFAGGIALYLYVAHSMRRAGHEGRTAPMGLLSYAHLFTLVGILLNGIGGLMRLYESDHPGIDRLGDSTWVQVLVVKHLFLIAGIALAGVLWWTTRRADRQPPPVERISQDGSRMAWFAAASFSTILLAAVLGAAAANVDLAADLGEAVAEADPLMDGHAEHGEPEVLAEFSTPGRVTGAPGRPGSFRTQATVPAGADRLTAVLTWDALEGVSAAELDLGLENPEGRRVPGAADRAVGYVTLAVPAEEVVPGLWGIVVTSERALDQAFDVRLSAVRSNGQGNVLNRTVTVAAGGEFFEANLLMGAGKTLSYEWSLVDATGRSVHFDIHLHVGGDVHYAVNGDYAQHNGTFTHDGSSQGPSLLWQNNATTPVRLWFRVTGDFSLHSYYPE